MPWLSFAFRSSPLLSNWAWLSCWNTRKIWEQPRDAGETLDLPQSGSCFPLFLGFMLVTPLLVHFINANLVPHHLNRLGCCITCQVCNATLLQGFPSWTAPTSTRAPYPRTATAVGATLASFARPRTIHLPQRQRRLTLLPWITG